MSRTARYFASVLSDNGTTGSTPYRANAEPRRRATPSRLKTTKLPKTSGKSGQFGLFDPKPSTTANLVPPELIG
jgi:hypothetical protein